MVTSLVCTGIRKGECLGLRITDLDMKNKMLRVRAETSKSKRERTVPLSPELIMALEDYLAFRGEDYATDALWVSNKEDRGLTADGLKHFITRLSRVTGINCHLHRFRHTFATNYYMQTHDIVGLKKILGHVDMKMTLSYLRSLPEVDTMRQMDGFSLANIK